MRKWCKKDDGECHQNRRARVRAILMNNKQSLDSIYLKILNEKNKKSPLSCYFNNN
jgi:hypothetical protein